MKFLLIKISENNLEFVQIHKDLNVFDEHGFKVIKQKSLTISSEAFSLV